MGKGMWLAALSGAGKSVADSSQEFQRADDAKAAALLRQADDERMLRLRADSAVEMQQRIAEGVAARERADMAGAGQLLADAARERVPMVAEPVTALSGAGAGEGYQSPDGTATNGLKGDYEAIKGQLAALPDGPDRDAALELLDKQFVNTQAQAEKAVEGKLVDRTPQEVIEAAYATAVKSGDADSAKRLKAMMTEKGARFMSAGDGEVLDTKTGKWIPRSVARDEREKQKEDRKYEYKDKELEARERASDKQVDLKERLASTKAEKEAAKNKVDPEAVEQMAQKLATYAKKPLGDRVISSAYGQAVMKRVAELNPEWSDVRYDTISKSTKAFSVGKQGDIVRSLNTSIEHIHTGRSMIEAMKNGEYSKVNAMANAFGKNLNTGPGQEAAVFELVKDIVGAEISKAVVGGPGTGAERQEIGEKLKGASSPDVLYKSFDRLTELMAGQLFGLRRQYKQGTGLDDFDENFLSSKSREAFSHFPDEGGSHSKPAAKPAAAAPSAPKDYSNLWD